MLLTDASSAFSPRTGVVAIVGKMRPKELGVVHRPARCPSEYKDRYWIEAREQCRGNEGKEGGQGGRTRDKIGRPLGVVSVKIWAT